MKREHKATLQHLSDLTTAVRGAVQQMDVLMHEEHSPERGKAIAKVLNALEYANDQARFFGLGIDFRTGKPRRDK